MDGPINCSQETLVRVRREVDDDLCSRGDGSRNLDIEHDFAVGSVGTAGWEVPSSIHGYGYHLGHGNSQLLKVDVEIAYGVASTELDDADTLALTIGTRGEII